jgi:hypothetical protein
MGRRERLGVPKQRLCGAVSNRAKNVEGDPAGAYRLAVGIQGPDPEGQVVEQERAFGRPGSRTVRPKDDRREELDPVGDELAVV